MCCPVFGFIFVNILYYVSSVQINYIRIPSAVQNGSKVPAILDCDYSLRPDDNGLAVKWYVNGSSSASYQWIPPRKPQVTGPLKNHLDLTYKASDDEKKMYRALKIVNPTTDLAGEYKCHVSTYNDEDYSSKTMIVFVPEVRISMYQGIPYKNQVNFTCSVSGVFPEPRINMYKNIELFHEPRNYLEIVEWTKSRHPDSKYDMSVMVTAPLVNLTAGDIIDCEMRLPGTGYIKKKSMIYYPPITDSNSGIILSMLHIVLVVSIWIILFI